jgi:hypothetical protein
VGQASEGTLLNGDSAGAFEGFLGLAIMLSAFWIGSRLKK